MTIKFKTNKTDRGLLDQIGERAKAMAQKHGVTDPPEFLMDVTACHLNGRPLDLERLLKADDFNFAHDVFGISQHIDRTTGKLGGHFVPRFARRA